MTWIPIDSGSDGPLYWQFAPQIHKPSNDATSDNRLIRLRNGMQALLCSDPSASSSGISMLFPAGLYDQPADVPGLAHLVEHCVFRFLIQHKQPECDVNAKTETLQECLSCYTPSNFKGITGEDWTTYSLQLAPLGLKDGLQHFSSILSPLSLTPSDVRNELISVQGEFRHMDQNDMCRLAHLNLHLSRPEARCTRDFEGGYESIIAPFAEDVPSFLPDLAYHDEGSPVWIALKEKVLEWWKNTYFIRPGFLVVAGREPLDELTSLVHRHFSRDYRKEYQTNGFKQCDRKICTSPWNQEHEGTVVFVKSTYSSRDLCVRWVIPWCEDSHLTKYADMLVTIMRLRGQGSLWNILRARQWAFDFRADAVQGDYAEGYEYFAVTIQLTEEGLAHWPNIVRLTQEFLCLVRDRIIEPQLLDDIIRMAETSFQFSSKEPILDHVHNLALDLSRPYARQDILRGPHIYFRRDVDGFRAFVREYFHLSKARVTLCVHRAHPMEPLGLHSDVQWLTAPCYGTKYFVQRLSADITALCTAEMGEAHGLKLPVSNAFVPNNFEVIPCLSEHASYPVLLSNYAGVALWYQKDHKYLVPSGYIRCVLDYAENTSSAKEQMCMRLLANMIDVELQDIIFNASFAHAAVEVAFDEATSLSITVRGYSDRLKDLFASVISVIHRFVPQKRDFETHLQDIREDLRGWCYWGLEPSNALVDPNLILTEVLRRQQCNWTKLLSSVEEITLADVQHYANILRVPSANTLLVYGNFRPQDALEVAQSNFDTQTPSKRLEFISTNRWFSLVAGTDYILELPRRGDPTSQISYLCEICDVHDVRSNIILAMVRKVIDQEVNTKLMDLYSMGYHCVFSSQSVGGKTWLSLTMETSYDNAYTERCIDRFLEDVLNVLELTSVEAFARQKAAFLDELRNNAKPGFYIDAVRAFRIVTNDTNGADANDTDKIREVEAVSLADLVKLFSSRIHPSSTTRRKLSVRLGHARLLSPRAANEILSELSAHTETPLTSDSLSELRLDPGTLLANVAQICAEAFPNASSEEVERIVRTNMELYPYESNDRAVEPIRSSRNFVFVDRIQQLRELLDRRLAADNHN